MEVVDEDSPEPAPRFESVIPHGDLHSADPEELNAFCLAVEGLLPRLARLRQVRDHVRRMGRVARSAHERLPGHSGGPARGNRGA